MDPANAQIRLPLRDALRGISVFADLADEEIDWLVERMEDRDLAPGEVWIHEGSPADALVIVLEGEIHARQERSGGEVPTYIARAGQVTGFLPFSRMTHFPSTTRAARPTRLASLHKDHFPEMLARIPVLGPRMVGVMSDRIREVAKTDLQRDKLMALGKLSAGLAHELNNPAAAARRSASELREALDGWRKAVREVDEQALTATQRAELAALEGRLTGRAQRSEELDPLERADREEELGLWLERHGVADAWMLAPTLLAAGLAEADLGAAVDGLPPAATAAALRRLAAGLVLDGLVVEIEASVGRISELVRAVKEYSHMDQAAVQEVDLHKSLESTLTMLHHRLKQGVSVVRDFDRSLPPVCAHASELNQVWTNLIDNAVDAMRGQGTLTLRTLREPISALVEVIDSGSGIPPEIQGRIFEPFFTTKPVGEGTGLGLDIVWRTVRNHNGKVAVESRPGETRFQVRLPLNGGTVGEKA